jgi:hypothetical protein
MRESAIRPVVQHACGTLSELSRQFSTGRISRDRWYGEVRDVILSVEASISPRSEDLAAFATPAAPGEADSAHEVAAEDVRRFADADRADSHSVQGHS